LKGFKKGLLKALWKPFKDLQGLLKATGLFKAKPFKGPFKIPFKRPLKDL
jgi:hypothetical protein